MTGTVEKKVDGVSIDENPRGAFSAKRKRNSVADAHYSRTAALETVWM